MQTTLLGLAIAIILALVAALVGPLVIDWGHHRALFEEQATRLVGVDVHVTGRIDARLLPSPQLTLHDIEIGRGENALRARALGIEFALGPLMRGEWRATEIRLTGPQLSLGLDPAGHVRAPNLAVTFRPDELSIDRLRIEDGTIALADAASGASLTLGKLTFNGEARSLIGPMKGEGSAAIEGKTYPFRIALGRLSDDNTLKVHVNVDPAERLLAIEGDGVFSFAPGEPRFDGALNLSRPVGIAARSAAQPAPVLTTPWRMGGKLKATAQSALIENLEFQYGSDEQGLKLTGVADFKFGARPRFNGVLSGRQIDVDRAVAGTDAAGQTPAAVIRRLAELGAEALRTKVPVQIGIGIDQVTLGGNNVQNVRGDISSAAKGWNLDRLEFRAPGTTQVRVSGRLDVDANAVAFTGPAEINSADPKALAAWLEGRNENTQSDLRPVSIRGDVMLSGEKIAIDNIKAEFDRKPLGGRFAYVFPGGTQPARLDAEIKAPVFDFDAANEFGKALLAGTTLERPREINLGADIGRATFAGVDARDAHARLKFDAHGLQIDQLSAADIAGGKFSASGRIDIDAQGPPRGSLTMDMETTKTAAISALIDRVAPTNAASVTDFIGQVKRAKLHATLDVMGGTKASTVAQLALAGDLDGMRIDTRARLVGDWQKLSLTDTNVDSTVDAPESAALIRLLGLDRFVAGGKGPGQLKLQAAGPITGDTALDIRLTADGLSGQISGRGRWSQDQGARFAGTVRVDNADVQPLRPTSGKGGLPLKLASRLSIDAGTATFDDIDAKLGQSSIHGRLALGNSAPRRVSGTLDSDAIDGPALIAAAIGMPASADKSLSSEPFGSGAFDKFSGTIALRLKHADLLPQVTAGELNATLHLAPKEIALSDVKGTLGGGRLSGAMTLRSAEDGLNVRANVALTGADAAALSRPVSGKLAVTAEVEGAGLSPVALVGALKGTGKITLTDARIAGLDPRTFDAVTRAVDQGLPIDNARIAELAGKSLDGGQLPVQRAETAMTFAAGQIRFGNTAIESKDASLSIASVFDLIEGSMDARLALSGRSEAAGARPEIYVTLKGALPAPRRSIDVSALNGWLTLRAVEIQAKRLRAIEGTPPQGRPAQRGKQAPALPAPIDIRPVPAPRSAGRPAASVDSQN